MEVYTLDPLLRREYVIDEFRSLIWTERYIEAGEFELVLNSTLRVRNLLKAGTKLAMNESNYVMEVKTVEDTHDDEGKRTLTVKGPSLELILKDRAAMGSLASLTTTPKWTITDEPADIMRKIFHDICVTGILDTQDIIPYLVEGTFMAAGTITEPADPVTVELEPTTVYQALVDLGKIWNLGFRMIRHPTLNQLYFEVYPGSDRTTSQTSLPAVVFTPELDNLQNTSQLTVTENAKNVAYVYSPAGTQVVYPLDVDPEVEGFERRVLVIIADDITSDNPDPAAAILQRGRDELAKSRMYSAFDGEINPNSQYKYGTHYFLGDVVELRNTDGATDNMRVTEQIFISDEAGERRYPTLTINTYINPGSWLSWENSKMWSELGSEQWADLP